MAAVKVQSATGNGATVALTSVAAANLVTYISSYYRNSSTGNAEATPTDSSGTMTAASNDTPQTVGSEDAGTSIFYQENVAAATHTLTPQTNTIHNVTVTEWSGVLA